MAIGELKRSVLLLFFCRLQDPSATSATGSSFFPFPDPPPPRIPTTDKCFERKRPTPSISDGPNHGGSDSTGPGTASTCCRCDSLALAVTAVAQAVSPVPVARPPSRSRAANASVSVLCHGAAVVIAMLASLASVVHAANVDRCALSNPNTVFGVYLDTNGAEGTNLET